MTYFYLDSTGAIRQADSIQTARAGTIGYLCANPEIDNGFITTSRNRIERIKRFTMGHVEYNPAGTLRFARDLKEIISDNGDSFYTIKCADGRCGIRYFIDRNGKTKGEKKR